MSQAVSVHLLLDTAEMVGEPRTGPRRFWTAREVMILKAVYPMAGLPGCLEKLPGRTPGAIYQQVGKLDLKSPRVSHPKGKALGSSDFIDGMIRRTYQNNPDTGSIKALAKTINRTRQWIRARAIKLGIAVPRFKAPDWLPAEIEIIAENPHLGGQALKRRLKKAGFERTEVAIVSKLGLLGVSTIDNDHYTANGLAKLFGIDIKVVTGWIQKGWLGAKRRGTERSDQQGGDQWWISRKQARRFVVGSVQVIDFRKLDKVWLVNLLTDTASFNTRGFIQPGRLKDAFMRIPPPKNRLDEEDAREVQKEIAHWLNDLDEQVTGRVFIEMRRQNALMKRHYTAATPRAREGILAGATDFDDLMEAEVRRDFLAAIRTGSTPEDAAAIAKEAAEGYVAKHNAQRPGDINWGRSTEKYHRIADLLVVGMRMALKPNDRPSDHQGQLAS